MQNETKTDKPMQNETKTDKPKHENKADIEKKIQTNLKLNSGKEL